MKEVELEERDRGMRGLLKEGGRKRRKKKAMEGGRGRRRRRRRGKGLISVEEREARPGWKAGVGGTREAFALS